ncbi:MAG: hypothetical protein COA52_00950 [Hyphomicrobiales bacterium]|nr:MAG: hypothetical protein COA52_00950 [Hyphomicrobiales bacterium]
MEKFATATLRLNFEKDKNSQLWRIERKKHVWFFFSIWEPILHCGSFEEASKIFKQLRNIENEG